MQLFANNAASKLAAPISGTATSIQVAAGDGAKFPSPGVGEFFLVTLSKFANGIESDLEIVKVTARSGDVFTVVRGQEGTTGQIYGIDDRCELRFTAATATNTEEHKNDFDNPHAVTKSQIGLSNVDNTSDALKPISTATQTALDLKAPIDSPTFTGTVGGVTKAMVGLGNVDNTTDAGKPISTATQTALDLKAPLASPALTGVPTAPTAAGGTNTTQLATTAFVAAALSSLVNTAPATLDTLNELAAALGNDPNFATTVTSALAAKAPLDSPTFTGTVGGITKSMVGLGNVDNTSDASKPISTATQAALDLKQGLDADLTAIAALAGTSGFLKKTAADTWALDTNTYLTGITSGMVTTALGFTPYNASNPNGYITSSASISGNAATATALATARTINGVNFDGTGNITVADATKLPLSGGTMTGAIAFAAGQTFPGAGIAFVKKTSAYTAVHRDGVIADTTAGPWTLTLPLSPAEGTQVVISDGGAWGTNSLTVARNGSTIEGAAENLVLNVSGALVNMIYDGTTWQVHAQIGGTGGDVVTLTDTQTLTNKTIALGSNTVSGTIAQFNTAVTDADFATLAGSETLTNKTLTDPAITGTILEDIYPISDAPAFEVDPGNGSIQTITLTASRTPKATNFANGEAITMMIDDGSAYTITWTDATWGGSGVVWKTDGGSAPTLNTTGYTAIVLWKVGGQVYGARVGNN